MVTTYPGIQSGNGPRLLNPNKDFPQLVELLRLVFGKEIESEGSPMFGSIPDGHSSAFLWRLDPALSRLSPGYVWELDEQIVGNVTLLPTRSYKRYLVANVAVHPDYRRKGIARQLVNAVQEDVRRRGGNEILLQVVRDNEAAIKLYQSMGYNSLGSMTTWRTSVSRICKLADVPGKNRAIIVRSLPANKWREAYRLDRKSLSPNLQWPDKLVTDAYKIGLWRRVKYFLNGRFEKTWMTIDNNNQLNGLATLYTEWGRPHQLGIRVHPDWDGQLEEPLLDKLISHVQTLPRRNVHLVHLADDKTMNRLLPQANFSRHRTLTHMRLELRD